MSQKGFTHLHLHSQYSLLDGAVRFDDLFQRCKELGMDSVAVTDHGNMFGVVEFYTKAQKAGIKPIIGIEAYVAPGSRFDKQSSGIKDASYHLVLLAENNAGYKNLLKLASIGYTEGFYYRPRIDKEVLAKYSEGLICTSACISGEPASMLEQDNFQGAEKSVDDYLEIFGTENYFLEIQKHKEEDGKVRDGLIELADKKGVGLVATNDVHFLNEEDYEAHNCLCCISTGKTTDDPSRIIYPESVFLKSPQQMRELFSDVPQACDNTLKIAERCSVELDLESQHAPHFNPPEGYTPESYLTELCYKGAEEKYGEVTEEIKHRIERELDVIEGKGFSSYFLINWEFCKWAHENSIPVGARGSGVGTIVGYCLGLCNIDPIKYDLLFERFMDPERDEMPDIDIDICQVNRPRLIEYVRQKYGQVAQIITFGTMKARAVIRDVCRVKNVPLAEADRLAKLVPDSLGVTLDDALDTEPDFKQAYQQDEQTREVIDIGKKLEGLTRHASVHAAGVVIADQPLTNFIPLYKASDSDDLVTQFEGPIVEKVGLLKMDFLGLKTLSVLERARQLVKINHGKDIDLEKVDIEDPKVFDVFCSGSTKGVFQFESGGMQDMLMKMKPDRLEDLIAANALYRPGPMSLIPDYIDRKHGADWDVPHPVMEEILKETFGIMVYQEQVMRIANRLGKIPLRQAYTMIKAISKKKSSVISKGREKFLEGTKQEGLSTSQAKEIWGLIERFAGYGFNKSHSARYAFIAYQTAYLKAYWSIEFMAALLTYEMGNTDKVVDYIGECKRMGIEVSAPDINESGVDFTPLYKNKSGQRVGVIRFGLAAVKGVGEKAVRKIIEVRRKIGKFHSLFHFCENVDLRAVNRTTIESLIKAGAFDRLGGHRAQMLEGLEDALQMGLSAQQDKQNGQMNFLSAKDDKDYSKDQEKLPDVPPWPEAKMLSYEKSVMGFYVTSNPLSHYAETIDLYSNANTKELQERKQDDDVVIGGMITKVRTHITKRGRNAGSKMAVFVLEDLQSTAEVVLFSEVYSRNSENIAEDKVVFVKGKVDKKRETPNIIAEEIIPIEDATRKLAARVQLKLDSEKVNNKKITAIKSLCSKYRGRSPVCVTINTPRGKVYARTNESLFVNPEVDFCKQIRQLVGDENFRITK